MFSFPDKLEFGVLEPLDLKKYNGQLILYGAGKVAGVVDYVLRQQGVEYLCFCDTYRAGGTHCGHRVISPEEMERDYPDIPVLVTTIHHRSVVDSLTQHNPRKILESVPLLVEVDFSDWGKHGEYMTAEWAARTITSYLTTMLSERIPYHFQELSVFVTQKCTLRCLDCSTLTPYYQSPVHYDPKIIMQSLKNLLSYDGIKFQEICLLGGEPLLHPEFTKILECALLLCQNAQVSVITNGTLPPRNEWIPLMQNSFFFVRISDYGVLSTQKNNLIDFFERYGIRYEIDNYSEWYESRNHLGNLCGEDEAEQKYRACTITMNRPLVNGRLFPCCKSANLWQLGAFDASPENSIDCLDTMDLYERLRAGLQRFSKNHIDICHRCSGVAQIHPDKMVPPAIQASKCLKLLY